MSEDCSPLLYGLNKADHFRKLKGFLNLLGIEERHSSKRILSELDMLKTKHGQTKMEENDVKLYVRLLRVLVDCLKLENLTSDLLMHLYIPDTNGILNPIHRLCLDEIDINSTEAMLFTHPSISPDIAVPLGVNTKREQKVKECSKPLKLYSKEFGQHEELITRIKRILSGYPCDAGILKELVQNADDAKANEVHIVLDFSSHPTDNLFSESWEPLQGPAILVYNDSCFSETDIVGIQSLGVVSKGEDPTKTGQYGVGFNAVYHITDVPSFLTRGPNVESGESLCVMDPHCNYVPDATHQCPGRQYLNTKLLKEDHPNVFSCYHEDLIMNESGTIFRLPLRTNKFKSKLSNHHINEKFIRELVSDFKNEMSEMLLFVNNVKSIKVSEIVDGHLEEKYSVTLNMSGSDESKRLTFYNAIENGVRKISENHNPVYGSHTEINYTLTVKNSCGDRSKWLIVRRMGFSGKCSLPENVLNAYANGEIGLLPRGGVALLLEHVAADDKNVKFKKELGRAFCFLPLPLETGLPVHVNGHFSLDHEARRNLWTDDKEGYRSAWNKHLMSDVIVPCYVSALHRLKYILCFDLENKVLPLDVFHGFFPNMGKVENIFKFLVCSFYQWIYTNEENIFPCCKLINKNDAKITFYPIKSEAFVFPCVFNTLKEQDVSVNLGTIPNVSPVITDRVSNLRQSTERKPSQDKDLAKLVQICKDIGIKLVESPEQIFKSMKEADIPVVEMTPDFFISFLKSHDTTHEDRCRIEQLGQSLEHTTIQKLKICIKYCQRSTTFSEQMENLPLCLTNDNVLRAFNSGSPVFCSVYCSLLQESSSHFLHYDCVDMFKCEQPGLKDFDINGFIQYLPDTLNLERYRTLNRPVEWKPDNTSKPNMEWIKKMWKFFTSVVCKQHNEREREPSDERKQEMNSETILNLLHPALHWCLIPCIQNQPTEGNISNPSCGNILVPACEARYIIDISTFSGTMKLALESLNLPIMDEDMYLEYDNILEHLVVKRNNPIGLLNMLYKCRDLIESRIIKPEYCLEIMDFFSDHMNSKKLANCSDEDVFKKLKGIPLHVSVSGDHMDIPSNQSVLVMDDIEVTDGIAEWAMHSSTLLLQTTPKLTKLYQKLGFTDENLKKIDLYRKHLLPKFRFLPQENHLVHLKYTRDVLLAKPCGQDFNDEQNSLISILQSVAFIPNSDGELSTASCFKNPRKKLMRLMFPESAFPTGVYREKEWNDFLSVVGMQCEITSEMIVQFARDIANAGENGITKDNKKDLENKSKKLLHHIYLCSTVDVNLLRTLCEIKFIPPFKVTKWKADIYPQPDADFLICFRNSTVRAEQGLCWTKCHIIPYWADPRNEQYCEKKKEMFDLLEIQHYPTYDNVIHHMQNICESLKRTEISDIFAESVENLMSSMYTFLMSKLGESDNIICLERGLSKMAVLYLPEQKMFVACNRVVKSINENEIIKPYLMEIPDKYHQFFELFEVLGMDRQVNVCNFVRVLALLKIDVNNDQLHINELQIVKQAIQRLFHYLQISTFDEIEKKLCSVETLYLLSRDNTLKDAKCLVYSDNTDFEEKIGDDIGMPYVASLDKLGVRLTGSFAKEFKKLPKHLQPNILSSLVSRQLQESFELLSLDENGLQLVALLSSPQFHQAVVRIAVHSRKTIQGLSPLELNEGVVNTWIENIQNIQVIQVKSCKLNLVFKDTAVGNEEVSCYYQKKKDNDDQNILYCAFKETDIKDWLQESSRVIEYAISHCTGRKFVDSGALLLKILLKIYNIDEMSVLLDREKVDEFCISVNYDASMFPSPGTTVYPDWHRFLDNSFSTFDPNEYVALLLSEEQMNKDEYTPSVYVYAIIIRKCETTDCESNVLRNTLQMYEVRVGRGRIERIHAFDLYKFNRNFQKTSKEIAPFIDIASNSSTDSRPLEDILTEVEDTIRAAWTLPEDERRKIIKRLYKKWHPDKNFGNELVATEVFKFIKQAVLNIERGNDINTRYDSQDFNEFSKDSQFWDHFQTWDQDTRHTTNQAPAAGTSGNENQSAHTRGRQCYEPVPSSADAKQWMHQAKRDFSAASQFLVEAEKGHNFNWICFLCQQVNYCTCYWKCLYCLFFQGFI
jgi:sacsin